MSRGPHFAAGRYWGKVVSQLLGETKNGNPQFILTFVVAGKIDPADPEGALISCEDYERSVFRVITDKTIQYVMEDLETLGFEGGSFSKLDPNTPGFHNFIGLELAFHCEHDTYEGTVREKWGIARDGGGLKVEPLKAEGVRKLDAVFGKQLKGIKKKSNGAAKPEQPAKVERPQKLPAASDPNDELQSAAASAKDDDSIPF